MESMQNLCKIYVKSMWQFKIDPLYLTDILQDLTFGFYTDGIS